MSAFADQIHVSISGFTQQVIFSDLKLTQRMIDHHDFSFTWMYSGKAIIPPNEQAAAIRQYTANDVIFTFKSHDGQIKVMSKGIITKLKSIDVDGSPRGLHVKGVSHTVFLSEQPKSRTFLDKTIKEVALQIFADETAGEFYQQDSIQPNYKKLFPSLTQFNETSFDFLKRLSISYGEWFYFDGMRMQFGQLKSSKVKLVNYFNLHDFTFKSKLDSHKTSLAGYDYNTATSIKSGKLYTGTGSGDGFSAMIRRNQFGVSLPGLSLASYTNQAQNAAEIEALTQRQAAANDANSIIYTGTSYLPIGVGQLFTIQNKEVYHELVAIKVTHSGEVHGNYKCKFKAIPADVEAPHYTNIETFRVADTQPALVTENNDPLGLGRVKVKYYWGTSYCESDWMRVMQQSAGKKWGQYYIPEIGDEVIVSFENRNADCPYVSGSHYNGTAKPEFFDSKNSIKGWKLRFGQMFKFVEKVGIWLSDPSGNELHFNEESKTITLTSSETIRIKAKDIIFEATGSITSKAGQNISEEAAVNRSWKIGANGSMYVGGTHYLKIKEDFIESIEGNLHSEVEKERNIVSNSGHISESENTEFHSNKKIQNNSTDGTTQN